MNDQRRAMAKLLRELADAVVGMTEEEFADCLRGRLHVSLSTGKARSKAKPRGDADHKTVQDVAAKLQMLSDREAGKKLLDDFCKTKSCLEQLARVLDLPVQREDTVDALREKVLEATIGFRLRSEAIRGKSSETT